MTLDGAPGVAERRGDGEDVCRAEDGVVPGGEGERRAGRAGGRSGCVDSAESLVRRRAVEEVHRDGELELHARHVVAARSRARRSSA